MPTIRTFLFTSTWVAFAGLLQGQTLRESVEMMLAYEPELLAVHADTQSTFHDVRVARGDLLPQIQVGGGTGFARRDQDGLSANTGEDLMSRQMSVSLRQLLFDGGSAQHRTQAARHRHEMQGYLERAMIEARVVDLIEVYFELLRADRRIREAEANIALHESIRYKVHERAEVGGTRADVGLVDTRVIEARDGLVAQQLAKKRAWDRFHRLVGRYPEGLRHPAVPAVPRDRGEVDLSGNWNSLAAGEAVLAAEDTYKVARRERLPDIFLDTGHVRGEDVSGVRGSDSDTNALVTFSWDLAKGGSKVAAQRREEWQVVKAKELQRAADLQRQYALTLLWREREADLTAVHSLRTQTGILSSVASDYEEQFLLGRRELLDILTLHERLYQSRVRLIDAEANLQVGGFRILGVQGRCVEFVMGAGYRLREVAGRPVEGSRDHPHHPGDEGLVGIHAMALAPEEDLEVEVEEAKRKGILRVLMPERKGDAGHEEGDDRAGGRGMDRAALGPGLR